MKGGSEGLLERLWLYAQHACSETRGMGPALAAAALLVAAMGGWGVRRSSTEGLAGWLAG